MKIITIEEASNSVYKAIDKVSNNHKVNQMKLAESLEESMKWLPYRNFVKQFLAQSKQLVDSQKYLKEGNVKLDKSIGIFNLPAIFTCPNSKDCQKSCYAASPQMRYENCRISRFVNLLAVMYYPEFVADQIVKQIKRRDITVVRIHESGDFYSTTYEQMWFGIIQELPEVKFYYYTKSDNTSVIDTMHNTNKVESILPDGSLNFGSIEYCLRKAKLLNVAICPVTKGHKDIRCGLTCTLCHDAQYMIFVQHKG